MTPYVSTEYGWSTLPLPPKIPPLRNMASRKRPKIQGNQWPFFLRRKLTTLQLFVTFLGCLSDPFKWLSDLKLGDETRG